jgi:DNA invertase Pin-like site-specific DNA recombinase
MRTQGSAPSIAAEPAIGYLTGPGDRHAIAAACPGLGLEIAGFVRDAPEDEERPELNRALAEIAAGAAACLVVCRLEDLSHATRGLEHVLDRVGADHLRLVVLDVGLDTARPVGQLALARRERPDLPGLDDHRKAEADARPPTAVAPQAEAPAPRSPRAEAPPVPVPAIGYASSAEPTSGGAREMTEQREAIEARCGASHFELVELVGDRGPKDGQALDRPGLSHALERIAAGDATCLVVSDLGRLSHSVSELGRLVRWLDRHRVRLVAIDLGLDTATESGRTAARALASVADWERERLSERTRAGLAAARAKRDSDSSAEATETAALHQRIAAMRADGMTLQAIADVLNAEGAPTMRGGAKWRPSSVQSAAGYRRPKRARTTDGLPGGGASAAATDV